MWEGFFKTISYNNPMGMDQLKYVEDTPEEEVPETSPLPENIQSNVIEGPWQKRDESATREISEKKEGKLIEGPWPKPASELKEPSVIESVGAAEKKTQMLEELRKDIMGTEEDKVVTEEVETAVEGEDDGGRKEIPFTEQFTQYETCEVCRGSGKRWFVVPCPVCRGTGRVPGKSVVRRGIM
jgi:hypothetical protein